MPCNTVYTQHDMQQRLYTTWHATKYINFTIENELHCIPDKVCGRY